MPEPGADRPPAIPSAAIPPAPHAPVPGRDPLPDPSPRPPNGGTLGPEGRVPAVRPLGLPRPLEVRPDERGRPLEVWRAGRGRREPLGRVRQVDEVWRLVDEWWRADPSPAAPPGGAAGAACDRRERSAGGEGQGGEVRGIVRTYFRVVLDGGRPLTLFHDDAHVPREPGAPRRTCRHWYEQPYARARAS